jgi:DNA modification methylase
MTKRANNLDGATWTRNSISIWSDIRKSQEEIALAHPAIFPSQLVARLIDCFTVGTKLMVLDPFSGSGSTIITAHKMNHIGIGFEVNKEYVELTNQRLGQRNIWQTELNDDTKIYNADARHILKYIPKNSIDITITSPPYWDILSQKRTADSKSIRDYGSPTEDLAKITDYRNFLEQLAKVFEQVLEVLKPKAYCIVNVMDIRKKNKFYPFHSDMAKVMEEIGFIYDDLIIWDRRQEYNNLRPLGYPSVFRINKIHEYLLIFQKPSG